MIQIDNTAVSGWEAAVRGMRNPMNSWDKSDSFRHGLTDEFQVGDRDLDLMKKLVKAGTDHSKFMRMINVTCDITAPLYWWKEMDTYKVGTVRNSCSTMHTITNREFMKDDFSTENVLADVDHCDYIIGRLNYARKRYLETEGQEQKSYWYSIIQLLPSSYNQRATTQLNYQVLRNIYHARKDHKLNEWHDFCHWVEGLPYSELITL
jgi:hypothetical protein